MRKKIKEEKLKKAVLVRLYRSLRLSDPPSTNTDLLLAHT